MKPPVPTAPQAEPDLGAYALAVEGIPGEAGVNYLVPLPPGCELALNVGGGVNFRPGLAGSKTGGLVVLAVYPN